MGPSSVGKSFATGTVSKLIPDEAVLKAHQISPKALQYLPPGSLIHRFVLAGERSRLRDDNQGKGTAKTETRANCLADGKLGAQKDSLSRRDAQNGEEGIRTPGTGVYPYDGLANRYAENASADNTKTCETAETQLTPQLTPNSRKHPEIDTSNLPPDLAEIVAIWPGLPGHIKAAIRALIQTHSTETK